MPEIGPRGQDLAVPAETDKGEPGSPSACRGVRAAPWATRPIAVRTQPATGGEGFWTTERVSRRLLAAVFAVSFVVVTRTGMTVAA
jgi:hypothetical protein